MCELAAQGWIHCVDFTPKVVKKELFIHYSFCNSMVVEWSCNRAIQAQLSGLFLDMAGTDNL